MKRIVPLIIVLFAASAISVRAADPKALWAANCAQCHGPTGKADTKMGKMLNAKDLTDPKSQASFTDAQATTAIKEGVKQNGKASSEIEPQPAFAPR